MTRACLAKFSRSRGGLVLLSTLRADLLESNHQLESRIRETRQSGPEGQCDRSLARSAWDIATPRNRPVGYGLILAGVRTSIR